MKIYGLNRIGLDFALALGNANFDGNVKFAFEPVKFSKVCFRLRLQHKEPGVGSVLLTDRLLIEGVPRITRRGPGVCWHAHRDFFLGIFKINPEARIQTSQANFENARDFKTYLLGDKKIMGDCACETP